MHSLDPSLFTPLIGFVGSILRREEAKAVEFCAFQTKAKAARLFRLIQAAVPPANRMAHVVTPYRRAGFRRESGLHLPVRGQHLDGKAAAARVDVHFEPAIWQLQGNGFNHAVIRIERDKAVQPPTGSTDGHHFVLEQLAVRLRAAGVVPVYPVILHQGFFGGEENHARIEFASLPARENRGSVFKMAPVYAVSAVDELRINRTIDGCLPGHGIHDVLGDV